MSDPCPACHGTGATVGCNICATGLDRVVVEPEELVAAIRRERARCLAAVDAEEELPGRMPDDAWREIQKECATRQGAERVWRATVRTTKQEIRSRIEAAPCRACSAERARTRRTPSNIRERINGNL